MGLKSAGNQNVLPRGQLEVVRDFSQVDEGFASGLGSVVPEEVFVQVFVFAGALQWEHKGLGSIRRAVGLGYLDRVGGLTIESWARDRGGAESPALRRRALKSHLVPTHLVNGVANGQHVGSKPLEFPSIFLHQSYEESAVLLPLIFLSQGQFYLWIGPEGICHLKEMNCFIFL